MWQEFVEILEKKYFLEDSIVFIILLTYNIKIFSVNIWY
jgi:hypothetical protein